MNFVQITSDNAHLLQDALIGHSGLDPYALSPAYLRFTGRRGLWILQSGDSLLALCRHPNIPDQMIAFPPLGPEGASLLRFASARVPSLRIGRVPHQCAVIGGAGFRRVSEDVLDWKYPVHTLASVDVAAAHGPDFNNIRAKVRRAKMQGVTCRPLSIDDADAVIALAKMWSGTQNQDLSMAQLIEPYISLLELYCDDHANLSGLAFEQNGRFVGMRVWESALTGRDVANSIGALARRDLTGLAEFQLHAVACRLAQEGVGEFCIGGSETPGLDAFKRKFRPKRSVSLSTLIRSAAFAHERRAA